jgi:hypothetical protein
VRSAEKTGRRAPRTRDRPPLDAGSAEHARLSSASSGVAEQCRLADPWLAAQDQGSALPPLRVVQQAIDRGAFALYLYLTLYLQDVLHLSALDAGLVNVPGSMLLFVTSASSAQLGERIEPARIVAGGLVLVAAGLALMR